MPALGREAFDEEFRVLLDSGSSSAHSMLAFIKRSLAQFNLSNSYTPTWVINEAYMRGIKLLATGKQIEKPLAWIRATAYNIIREQSRERSRFLRFEESMTEIHVNASLAFSEEIEEELFKRVNLAFEKLEPEEKEILSLKMIKNLSWKEIQLHLILQGKEVQNEATLRKRKERALKHLRSIYHSLELQNV
ncbi:sigma-70 family RNA polymerase sigma factor [Nostoc sp.]|uniref:sigma-70 family RNA polymerase sigma factor n=1 Tax=Nostoc sp. TaxID=1180 RepID=UPI002FF6848E